MGGKNLDLNGYSNDTEAGVYRQRVNYVAEKDVQVLFTKEECPGVILSSR